MTLSDLTSSEAVLAAIAECDELGRDGFLKKYGFKYSRLYPLIYEGKTYDSKAIAGVAYGKQHGTPLKAKEFSGGIATVVPALRKLGFDATEVGHPTSYLQKGRVYFRKDLVERYGGQLQSGIWTPREFPVVFIFSGESGEIFGYRDGWTADNGVFRYTGEGQIGDMVFDAGNKAIRDHREEKRDLLLFIDLGKGKGVRYDGVFECASWALVPGKDKTGADRRMIVFDLVPVAAAPIEPPESPAVQPAPTSVDDLRKAAYEAAAAAKKGSTATSDTRKVWYERSERIKRYVLARANGICEACDQPAPFARRNGTPYLEPHHTTRLADEGPDHPAWVGAICPNCHRRIHSGTDGREWNLKLQGRLRAKEASMAAA